MKNNVDIEKLEQIKAGLKTLRVPDKIVFPFKQELNRVLPLDNVRVRRDIKKFVALIKASALFHQNNRNWMEYKGQQILIADWRDVRCVMDYAGDTLIATTQGMGERDMLKYQLVDANSIYLPEFTTEDVARWCKCKKAGARRIMSKFVKEGFFENITRPPESAIYKQTGLSPNLNCPLLPTDDLIKSQQEKIDEWKSKLPTA